MEKDILIYEVRGSGYPLEDDHNKTGKEKCCTYVTSSWGQKSNSSLKYLFIVLLAQ
jgi:hypothetical protein